MNLAAVESYNNELNVRIQRIRAGTDTPDVTLQAIRFGSAAMVQYYQFVGQYNAALANYEFAKGTLLRRDKVMVEDGPLPACTQVKAVEHEQEREKACVVHERAVPAPCDGASCAAPDDGKAFQSEMLSLPASALLPEVKTPPAPLPKTLDQMGSTPGPVMSVPSVPVGGSPAPSSFGTVRPLTFPDDRKVPSTLPALP